MPKVSGKERLRRRQTTYTLGVGERRSSGEDRQRGVSSNNVFTVDC